MAAKEQEIHGGVTEVQLPSTESGHSVPRHVAIRDGWQRPLGQKALPASGGRAQTRRRGLAPHPSRPAWMRALVCCRCLPFSSGKLGQTARRGVWPDGADGPGAVARVAGLHQQGVQIHFPGDTSSLSKRVVEGQQGRRADGWQYRVGAECLLQLWRSLGRVPGRRPCAGAGRSSPSERLRSAWLWPMCPIPICSSAPVARCGSAIS